MSKLYVIWGCAGHAKVLASLIESKGGEVVTFFDNREIASILPRVPIRIGEMGFSEWVSEARNLPNITGLVAIGGHGGRIRMRILDLFRTAGLALGPLIHPTAFVCKTAILGEGSQVLAHALVATDCRLGPACIVNHKASVDHECIVGNGVHFAPGSTVCGCVTIGDNVMIGAGAVVLPRLTIGPDAMIGAGAVVTKDVPAGAIVVGNPGRNRPD